MIVIQSDKRIGLYYPNKSKIGLSKSRSGGSYFPHLQLDDLITVELSPDQNKALREAIVGTAGHLDNGFIQSDNTMAVMIPETPSNNE